MIKNKYQAFDMHEKIIILSLILFCIAHSLYVDCTTKVYECINHRKINKHVDKGKYRQIEEFEHLHTNPSTAGKGPYPFCGIVLHDEYLK